MTTSALAPVISRLDPAPDPLTCCERMAGWPYRLLLDSAAPSERLGRYSFLAADPGQVVRARGSHVEAWDEGRGWKAVSADLLLEVRRRTSAWGAASVDGLPPFQGGAAGYVGYDWSRTLERVPSPRHDDLCLPDAVLGIYDWVLAWDHVTGGAWIISTGFPEREEPRRLAKARARAALVETVVRTARPPEPAGIAPPVAPLAARCPSVPVSGEAGSDRAELRSTFSADEYRRAVERVREYIVAGDIFQANLSQRFEAPLAGSPWTFYERLRARSAAPFGAFFEMPDAAILSTSPERFLRVDQAGSVETRPIKGTRPRGIGPEHDAALGPALVESQKDRAENLMIVDLMRNDLSKVCAPGSIRVPELFALEHYATVHHLVSTVVGTLTPGMDAFDLLRAAFPGGSITGAPKVRAMEIIAELEPSARGVYCGTIGYWSFAGSSDTSIAIRTAIAKDGRVTFSAGGGIVADSDAEREYRETLDKARSFIDAVGEASP